MSKFPWPLPLTVAKIPSSPISFAALAPAARLLVMLTMLVALPAVPQTPGVPAELPLPHCTRMAEPLGKLEMTLLEIVALATFATVLAEPFAIRRMPEPFEEDAEVLL